MQNCYNRSHGEDSQIPIDVLVEQDKRLTRTHIQTLTFVQEIGRENKRLTTRVAELEKELSKCAQLHEEARGFQEKLDDARREGQLKAEEITKRVMAEHNVEIENRIRMHADEERTWCSLKQSLQTELFKLQQTVAELHQKNGRLEETVASLQSELQSSRQSDALELSELRQAQANLLSELGRLESANRTLTEVGQDLHASEQKRKEQNLKISILEVDLEEARALDHRDKFHRAKEKARLLKQQNEQLTELVRRLKKEREDVSKELHDTRRENEEKDERIRVLEEEGERLREAAKNAMAARTQLSAGSADKMSRRGSSEILNFRDFVGLKRELGALREENAALKEMVKASNQRLLPPIASPTVQTNLGGPPVNLVGVTRMGVQNLRKPSR